MNMTKVMPSNRMQRPAVASYFFTTNPMLEFTTTGIYLVMSSTEYFVKFRVAKKTMSVWTW